MKKKIFILGVICFVMIFALTGCGNKKVLSTADFKEKVENLGYTTKDVSVLLSTYRHVSEATVAKKSDSYQVEFYVLIDEENAKTMFNTNKAIFESYKSNISKESTATLGNYSSYTLTSGGYYMYLCRVDNTLLYLRVKDTYKEDVKLLVEELGY